MVPPFPSTGSGSPKQQDPRARDSTGDVKTIPATLFEEPVSVSHPAGHGVLLCLLMMAFSCLRAFGQSSTNFDIASGSWHDPLLWSAGIPTSINTVQIGGPLSITATISAADALSGEAWIGSPTGETGLVQILNARTWTVSGTLNLGDDGGTGEILLSEGGIIISDWGRAGSEDGGTGRVTIRDVGSSWQSTDLSFYNGSFNIEAGGHASSGSLTLGNALAWGDTVTTVTGAGSRLEIAGLIDISHGLLAVQDGGHITSEIGGIDDSWNGGSAAVNIQGNGSWWEIGTSLNLQSGTVQVDSGGLITSDTGSVGGTGSGGSAIVIITGAGSAWEVANGLTISSGSLTIENGGLVSNDTGIIGAENQSPAELIVTGENSLWENAVSLIVRNGSLRIEDGGQVNSTLGNIGYTPGAGAVTISGEGSNWHNTGQLFVGSDAEGTLRVENGGSMDTIVASIGTIGAGAGAVTITGENSEMRIQDSFTVGNLAGNDVVIENGGQLTAGSSAVNGGAVTVKGAGSQLLVTSLLELRGGEFRVEDGGSATAQSVTFDNTTGSLTVTGNDSVFAIAGNLDLLNGTVTVESGGRLAANAVVISGSTGEAPEIHVNGISGSRGVLEVAAVAGPIGGGEEDPGTLQIHVNGGVLRATQNTDSFISGDNVSVTIGSGGAYVDTQSFNVTMDNGLSGEGGLTKVGTGKLTLEGTHTYQGGTRVEEGLLWINGSVTGEITVVNDGILGGSSTLGNITVADGGSISPGNSPGIMNSATQTWAGGGVYIWETNALNGIAGTNWDLILINGDLDFTASVINPFTLAINSLNISNNPAYLAGFDLQSDYSWEILRVTGSINGFDPGAMEFDVSEFWNEIYDGYFDIEQSGNSLFLNYNAAAVPEPGGGMLVILSGMAFLICRRRPKNPSGKTARWVFSLLAI